MNWILRIVIQVMCGEDLVNLVCMIFYVLHYLYLLYKNSSLFCLWKSADLIGLCISMVLLCEWGRIAIALKHSILLMLHSDILQNVMDVWII